VNSVRRDLSGRFTNIPAKIAIVRISQKWVKTGGLTIVSINNKPRPATKIERRKIAQAMFSVESLIFIFDMKNATFFTFIPLLGKSWRIFNARAQTNNSRKTDNCTLAGFCYTPRTCSQLSR
jgi:hypothetical protein